ncbi:hypothetical protein GGD57_001302 [Rhizobium esperanzae]|uniref:Uncharacterized protein n=1 Tax=Rhizobium esperanzae TaxID=1967781 RepID=A0A7W6W3X6_9HYPH|nr:hypothetical protein [Rhizobium esperanzae]MBB4234746.1 hypothetical protein [Rhizobium esperanzae]
MVLEIAADTRQTMFHLDAVAFDFGRIANAGQHQDLWRVDGAGGKDDFATRSCNLDFAVLFELDPDRLFVLEHEPADYGIDLHRQVRTLHGGPQEGSGRRRAPTVFDVEIVDAETVLRGAVEVGVERIAGLFAGLQIDHGKLIDDRRLADRQDATGAVEGIVSSKIFLRLAEIGQHILERPAGIAKLAPRIEIMRISANILSTVENEGPAEHFPAWKILCAPLHILLRQAVKRPIVALEGKELGGQKGQIVDKFTTGSTGLEQQDLVSSFAQSAGKHGSRRTASYDDKIIV